MKKSLSIIPAIFLALSLTACDTSPEPGENSSDISSGVSEPVSDTTDPGNFSSSLVRSAENSSSSDGSVPVDTPPADSTPSTPSGEPLSGAIDWNTVPCADEKDFLYEDVDGGAALTQYLGTEKIVKVPPTVDGKKVVVVNFPNFSGTDICIPDCVGGVSAGAFYESATLRSAAILGGSSIGGKAFNNCAYLESVTLPSGLTEIGEDAFLRCIKLKSITIPEGATSIGRQAFARCRQLTSVTIPDSVKKCGEKAFDLCSENIQITFKGKTYKYDDLDSLYQDINSG